MRRESIKVARSSARVQSVWSGTPRTRAISEDSPSGLPLNSQSAGGLAPILRYATSRILFWRILFWGDGPFSWSRAIFRALQRLLEALEVRRAISPLWFHRRRSPRA